MTLQAKAVIIADGGFDGIFSHGMVGLGLDLALRAGVPLRDMEFVHTHLGMKRNMILPSVYSTMGHHFTKPAVRMLNLKSTRWMACVKPLIMQHSLWMPETLAKHQNGGMLRLGMSSNELESI